MAEVSEQFHVHPTQIIEWKQQYADCNRCSIVNLSLLLHCRSCIQTPTARRLMKILCLTH